MAKNIFENFAFFWRTGPTLEALGWYGHKFNNVYSSCPKDALKQKMVITGLVVFKKKLPRKISDALRTTEDAQQWMKTS